MSKKDGQASRGSEPAPWWSVLTQFWNQQSDRGRALLASVIIILFLFPCCALTFVLSGDTIVELATLFVRDKAPQAVQDSIPTPKDPTPEPTFTPLPTSTSIAHHEPTQTLPVTPISSTADRIKGRVLRVVDGSTIEVESDRGIHHVRYAGIDCAWPSIPITDEDRPGDDILEANQRMVAESEVYLEPVASGEDAPEEMSCYVWVGGVLVNAELVHQGYARPSLASPDEGYHDLLTLLEQEARHAERGLWQKVAAETLTEETPTTPSVVPTEEMDTTESLSTEDDAMPLMTEIPPTATFTPLPLATSTPKPATLPPTATDIPTNTPAPQPTDTPVPTSTPAPTERDTESECAYVGSVNSDKYHDPDCRWASEILPENRVCFDSKAEAQAAGYVPCKVCKP